MIMIIFKGGIIDEIINEVISIEYLLHCWGEQLTYSKDLPHNVVGVPHQTSKSNKKEKERRIKDKEESNEKEKEKIKKQKKQKNH